MKFTREDIMEFDAAAKGPNYRKDKKGNYLLFKGKKLYLKYFMDSSKNGSLFEDYSSSENRCYCIYVKKGNNYKGVFIDAGNNIFYKGKLIKGEDGIGPDRNILKNYYNNEDPRYKFDLDNDVNRMSRMKK